MTMGHDEFDTLPAGLVAALKRLDREAVSRSAGVPASVDTAVRASAESHFSGGEREVSDGPYVFPAWVRWAGRLAAAAMVTAGVGLWWVGRGELGDAEAGRFAALSVGVSGDVNGDGARDIVDAMVLARAVERQDGVQDGWDYNADGAVDSLDVDTLAMRVVALGEQVAAGAREATQRVVPGRWVAGAAKPTQGGGA